MQETLQKHLYRYRHSLVPRQLGYEASTDKKKFVLNYFTQAAQNRKQCAIVILCKTTQNLHYSHLVLPCLFAISFLV